MQHRMNGRTWRALFRNAAQRSAALPAALGYTSAHSYADLHTRMAECRALHAADAEGGLPALRGRQQRWLPCRGRAHVLRMSRGDAAQQRRATALRC
jgi:hypothetical protein